MEYKLIDLYNYPNKVDEAASWFSKSWGIPKEAYLECMEAYLKGETPYGWYLCLCNNEIIAGLGVIKNDFHKRVDLYPNICAVYVDEAYRGHSIAGKLLNMAVEELKKKNVSPVYLLTVHIGFYEKYGFEFYEMVENEDGDMSRMYIHR
ncbi:MAG: GNAT family N-acetyltransferase [Acholeplasmatales bacterium]|nr:GNAT family N-acetyltransferase [Acholeplasmatales bacterium]